MRSLFNDRFSFCYESYFLILLEIPCLHEAHCACLYFVVFLLKVIKFCSGRQFFSNHLILSRFVFKICWLLHSLHCKASVTFSLRFSLSGIFTERSHSQEIFVPWLVAPQVSLCAVSPKRLVQLIVPSCYSFSSSSLTVQTFFLWLSVFSLLEFWFPFSHLSQAAMLCFWSLFFVFNPWLDFQAEIVNMCRGQVIGFSFLRDHTPFV